MMLRQFLHDMGTKYDRAASTGSPGAQLIRSAPHAIGHLVPGGFLIKGSAGNGNTAVCPWVSFFDPDETTSATHGMYLVYLLAEDSKTVALSLIQGVTELTKAYGASEARERLSKEAAAIREALPSSAKEGLNDTIDLGGRAGLPRSYEAGNLLAVTYEIAALPTEDDLRRDLGRLIGLYQDALAVREALRRTSRDLIATVQDMPKKNPTDAFLHFAPKSDAEYQQTIEARTITKLRSHEKLIKQYGEYLIDRNVLAGTNVHPRDMVIVKDGDEWLVEAKFVSRGDATTAMREAIGQLAHYSYCHYSSAKQPRKLALFSEPVGDLYVALLEHENIASVWHTEDGWAGSPTAVSSGLAEGPSIGASHIL